MNEVSAATTTNNWIDHVNKWKDCQLCPLGMQRSNICLARGTLPCDVLFIGEAPGASEDTLAQPFVGPAGQLMDQIIERAIPPEVTYALTNLVACFPREAKARGENEPEPEEILACRPRLYEFVNIAQPRLVVCVGTLAVRYVEHTYGVNCVHIVHPAHILARLPAAQKEMAANKSVVVIRTAVFKMLESPRKPFTNWEIPHASITSQRKRLRAAAEAAERELPF